MHTDFTRAYDETELTSYSIMCISTGGVKIKLVILYQIVRAKLTIHRGSKVIMSDFNCTPCTNLCDYLPKYHQFVKCTTRDNNTNPLDHLHCDIENGYKVVKKNLLATLTTTPVIACQCTSKSNKLN